MDFITTIPDKMVAGQKRNLTSVINEYSKRLLGFIRKRVNNEEDAEDILQDVFYQLLDTTRPIEQLTSWLFTVARNKIIDQKRKNEPDLLEDIFPVDEEGEMFGWEDILLSNTPDPEMVFLRNVFWEELMQALDELPEKQKQVFIRHELEGVSFKEMATQTGETINTLISQKHYAVLHLRKRLSKWRNELPDYE